MSEVAVETRRVLVVDDNAAYSSMVSRFLSLSGFEVTIFGDREDLLSEMRSAAPDVVLLDLHLEGRSDAWQIMQEIRRDPITRDVRVIVCSGDVSALAERADELQALRCAVLAKPYDVDDLLLLVQQSLGLQEAR